MNDQLLAAGIMLVNQLLAQAMQVSQRIQQGTLTQDDIDRIKAERLDSRNEQLAELAKARTEGR